MKTLKTLIAVFAVLTIAAAARADTFSVLHSFTGNSSESYPSGNLTLVGSTLYGTTQSSNETGTVFKIGADGTGYSVLHYFDGVNDGYFPTGGLILTGGMLYGMASYGSSLGLGTIFKIDTVDGSGFSVIHPFEGPDYDGAVPRRSLTISADGNTLYGMTYAGGSSASGSVFKTDTSGNVSLLHSFLGIGGGDGAAPAGSLTLSADGNTLYGMTSEGGGASESGTIFEIDTVDGSGYSTLYEFDFALDGGTPIGDLTLIGTTLYGMTTNGGENGYGTVFKYDLLTTDFAVLHSFNGTTEGRTPTTGLTLVDDMLYGMTRGDRRAGIFGSLFKIDTDDGSAFAVLRTFTGASDDGADPYSTLVLSADGNTLYGTTRNGGANNAGIVFSYELGGGPADIPEPSTLLLLLPFIGFGVRKLQRKFPLNKGGEGVVK